MFVKLPSTETLIFLAGVGQLALVAVSPAIPHVLAWRRELSRLSPLTRRLFWIYAAYILSFNLAFGLVSTLAGDWLLAGTELSRALCAFIALYWGARLICQFACFSGIEKPSGTYFRIAEAALIGLFVSLTLIYGMAAWV